MVFPTLPAPINPRLLFANSRPVAPVCSTKPPPIPVHKSHIQHAVLLPPNTPTTNEFNTNLSSNRRTGPALPDCTRHVPASQPAEPHDSEGDDISEEDLSRALQDLAQSVGIWEHVLQTDEDAAPPPPCSCHDLPVGSCPERKERLVNQISLCSSFGVANMDGAKSPLSNPSFNHQVWRDALGFYFDADEIANAIQYGWDPSFTSRPYPKDATRNNASAMQFPEHVLHYVDKELGFGALVGPFLPSELPFLVFRSPFGSVKKIGSFWRRTVTDCSQLSSGINAFIDPRSHRGAP